MKKIILFMDNTPSFLNVQSRLLEQLGYQVSRASTIEEAEKKLQEEHIHLAILDIRMEDENDEQDISGLVLARKDEYRSIPKIILTAHTASSRSYKYVREAFEPSLDGRPAAVGFVAKDEGPDALIQTIEQAFTQRILINWNLVIHWEKPSSFAYLVNHIDPIVDNNAQQISRADELEYLLRKLFYTNVQITIGRLFTHAAGRIDLEVFTFTKEGKESQFIISGGRRQDATVEDTRYEAFVPKGSYVSSTIKVKTQETINFAATVYELVSGKLEDITSFGDFYRNRSATVIQVTLDHLFGVTLAPWYEKGRFYEEIRSWNELYREWLGLHDGSLVPVELEYRIEVLCRKILATGVGQLDYTPRKLAFHLMDGSFVSYPNPISGFAMGGVAISSLMLCGITHGKVNINTVLVDHNGQTWLVDFSQTDQGPLLRDFVSLEMAIKLNLLDTTDLQMLYEFEKRLLAAAALNDTIPVEGLTLEFDKPLRTVTHIRDLAATVAGPALEPYLIGLFFYALAHVARFDPTVWYTKRELIPFAHSLLMAAMLCEKLTSVLESPAQQPAAALDNLWINVNNKEVWVEGRQVDLTPQEFDMLAYLYKNRGLLCSRQAIVEKALGERYEEEATETSRLNSAMSRLRQKIESDPEHPQYIITVRGHGYKLVP